MSKDSKSAAPKGGKKVAPLPAKPLSDKDAQSVKGGATTTGVKKTMQTQV